MSFFDLRRSSSTEPTRRHGDARGRDAGRTRRTGDGDARCRLWLRLHISYQFCLWRCFVDFYAYSYKTETKIVCPRATFARVYARTDRATDPVRTSHRRVAPALSKRWGTRRDSTWARRGSVLPTGPCSPPALRTRLRRGARLGGARLARRGGTSTRRRRATRALCPRRSRGEPAASLPPTYMPGLAGRHGRPP